MFMSKITSGACVLLGAAAVLTAPDAYANDQRPTVETEIVRLVGGAGFGFCEFTRRGRRVTARGCPPGPR